MLSDSKVDTLKVALETSGTSGVSFLRFLALILFIKGFAHIVDELLLLNVYPVVREASAHMRRPEGEVTLH